MKRMVKVSALAAVLSMMLAGWANAADQTILGRSFIVKNPGSPDKRRVTGAAKEVDSPNTLTGDPTLPGSAGGAILGSAGGAILGSAGGAVLTIIADGAHSSQQIFALKQGKSSTGKPFWRASVANGVTNGFKYKDPNGRAGCRQGRAHQEDHSRRVQHQGRASRQERNDQRRAAESRHRRLHHSLSRSR